MNVSDVLTCKIASCEKQISSDQLAQTHNMKALADLQPAHAIRIAASNFDRFCCFFPWCLIVAINNMPRVYNSFIIQENVRRCSGSRENVH